MEVQTNSKTSRVQESSFYLGFVLYSELDLNRLANIYVNVHRSSKIVILFANLLQISTRVTSWRGPSLR